MTKALALFVAAAVIAIANCKKHHKQDPKHRVNITERAQFHDCGEFDIRFIKG